MTAAPSSSFAPQVHLINLCVVHTILTSVVVPNPPIHTCPLALTNKVPSSTHHLTQSSAQPVVPHFEYI